MKSLILSLFLLLPAAAWADGDHERVRRAVEAGEILPLRTILDRAAAMHSGQFVEAELEVDDGRMVYEIKLLAADGRVIKLLYDARTGEALRTVEKERHRR